MQVVTDIYAFNQQAGLLDRPYDDFLESSYQIEEALEGFDLLYFSNALLDTFKAPRDFSDMSPKDVSRSIVRSTGEFTGTDVERFDKALDAIVYAFGSIFKLRLTPEQALRGLSAVVAANQAKLAMPKDQYGKLCKPAYFVGPEAALQAILDERHT